MSHKRFLISVLIGLPLLISSCKENSDTMNQMVTFEVKAAYLDAFIETAMQSLEGSLQEEGNIEMHVYQDNENPSIIYVFSRWKNQKAIDYHDVQPHSKPIKALAPKALQSPPEIKVGNDVENTITNAVELKP